MKRLSLVWLVSACALVAEACSGSGGPAAGGSGGGRAGNPGAGSGGAGTAGAAAGGGAAGSGSAGTPGGGSAGIGGTAGSACPRAQPVTGTSCRSQQDCPQNGLFYYCTTDPGGVSSACATPFCATTPVHDCTVDTDCPTGDICITVPIRCCTQTSTVCHVSCTASGVACAAGTTCSPGAAGADDDGCVPVLCNAGYTCPAGFACAVGASAVDAHGCQALPCSQTGCPANFACTPAATIGGCTLKRCSTDCDCDFGFCVGGSCSSELGTCVSPPV